MNEMSSLVQKPKEERSDFPIMLFTVPRKHVLQDRLNQLPEHFTEARAALRREIY